jgi:membrane protease YdiL (CAAX protease family)
MTDPSAESPVPPPAIDIVRARPIGFVLNAETPTRRMTARQVFVDLAILVAALFGFAVYSGLVDLHGFFEWVLPSIGGLAWVFGNGVVALVTMALLLRWRGQSWSDIGLNRPPIWPTIGFAAAAVPACFLAGFISNVLFALQNHLKGRDLNELMQERAEFFAAVSHISMAWVAPISIFVGIYEEILFRGFLLSRLRENCRGPVIPIVVSSLLFGAVHYFAQGWIGVFNTMMVGTVLAIVVTWARSLWPAIIAHAAFDTINIAITVISRDFIQEFLREAASAPAG